MGIITTSGGILDYDDTDPLTVYAHMQHVGVLSDRFSGLNQFSPWKLHDQNLSAKALFSESAQQFADITDQHAYEICLAAEAMNKQIYISWSGGVDSTCVACAFLKQTNYLSRIHILYSDESFDEYNEFFGYIAPFCIKRHKMSALNLMKLYKECLTKGYIVFGWCGDQLFGSDLNLSFPDYWHKDWHELLQFKKCTDEAIQQYDATFEQYGLPIKNTAQFFWWMNFSCKWNFVSNDFAMHLGSINDGIINFFDTHEYQVWACNRYDKVDAYHPTVTEHYKEEMKDYIYNLVHDEDYRQYKGKVGSWGRVYYNNGTMYPVKFSIRTPEGIDVYSTGRVTDVSHVSLLSKDLGTAAIKAYRKQQ